MENIKKIMLSMFDNNKIKRMVVVGEDKIEVYSKTNLSNDEIMKAYTKYVKILKEKCKIDELEYLSEQDKVQELVNLDLIEQNDDKLVVSIIEYDEPKQYVIKYDDGVTEVIKLSDFEDENNYNANYKKMLDNICKSYDIPITNIKEEKNNLRKMGIYSKNLIKNNLKDDDIDDYLEENKIKNFIVNHPFISGLIGSGLIAILVCSGIKLANKNNNSDEKEKTTIELELPKETEKPIELIPVTKEPIELTPEIEEPVESIPETEVPEFNIDELVVDDGEDLINDEEINNIPEIYFSDEDNNYINYPQASDNNIIMCEVNGQEYYNFNQNLESLMQIRNSNMDNISNKIQSNINIEDKGMYIYYENLFNDYSLEDKAFVRYFSMLGNQIIKCAYHDQNFDVNFGVNKYAKKSCYEFIHYVRDNEPLYVLINGESKVLYYSNLSREAKEAVLNIALANYTTLNSSPELYKNDPDREESLITEFTYNGESISKSDVIDIIMNAYNELMQSKQK